MVSPSTTQAIVQMDGEVLRYRLRDRKGTLLLSEIELNHDSAEMFSIGRAIKGEKGIFIVDAEASYIWLSSNQTWAVMKISQ